MYSYVPYENRSGRPARTVTPSAVTSSAVSSNAVLGSSVLGITRADFASAGEVRSVVAAAPLPLHPLEIAPGLWWIRIQLASLLKHVNVYLMEDHNGWLLVDTGSQNPVCRDTLAQVLKQKPFAGKPLKRVWITHQHPDHIGLAGWLAERGAVIHATPSCWNTAQRLLASPFLPTQDQIDFQRRGGLSQMEIEAFQRRNMHAYSDMVTPLPKHYAPIGDGQELRVAERSWKVQLGNGHAADHVTLWSDDGLAIVGDQILPGISASLCVHACQAGDDPVGAWLQSCRKFAGLASPNTLCLPGHNLPFTGISKRCQQIVDNLDAVLSRLLEHLARPRTAVDCLELVFRRPVPLPERPSLVTQVVGYLSHLKRRELIGAQRVGTALLWSRKS